MKIFAYIISGLAAFMAVGTQHGLDRYKIQGTKFLHRKIHRKNISNKVMHFKEFGNFVRNLKKLEEMKSAVAKFK